MVRSEKRVQASQESALPVPPVFASAHNRVVAPLLKLVLGESNHFPSIKTYPLLVCICADNARHIPRALECDNSLSLCPFGNSFPAPAPTMNTHSRHPHSSISFYPHFSSLPLFDQFLMPSFPFLFMPSFPRKREPIFTRSKRINSLSANRKPSKVSA